MKSSYANTFLDFSIEFREASAIGGSSEENQDWTSSIRFRKKIKDQEQAILKSKVYLDDIRK